MADINSINLVLLVGRVAGDIKFDTGKGKDHNVNLARFSLATNEVFQESKNRVEYHTIVAFGTRAELCHKYCRKGMLLAIKGRLRHNTWQDEQGNKRYSTQINIDEITFLGKKEDFADGPQDEEPSTKKWEGKDDPL